MEASLCVLAAPLVCWILLSGVDDLIITTAWLFSLAVRGNGRRPGGPAPPQPEKRIAIFLPLWDEADVASGMLAHNLAAIRYSNYTVFAGVYPNDAPTAAAVREVSRRHSNVEMVVCPHNGPTSKADCLNAIWQGMLAHERRTAERFEVVVLHDAEDLIHSEELTTINACIPAWSMVQIPVLPLATPAWEVTHGVYCDEFAEYQTKDVPVRQILGGFLPSNGVGTGYAREALEQLCSSGVLFDPACLTEDYEIGYRLHRLGLRQLFIPIAIRGGAPAATREYFPRRAAQALRQRTRWVTGIALQSWQRHGWGSTALEAYWFWRDRKGLIGNPLSLFANALTILWLVNPPERMPVGEPFLVAALVCQSASLAARICCSARIYGLPFALGAPVRAVWANLLNATATARAVGVYAMARIRHTGIGWAKTNHAYPSVAALGIHKRRIGEILVETGAITVARLEEALGSKPPGMRLGEHLVNRRTLDEDAVYAALGIQHGLPVVFELRPDAHASLRVPGRIAERWNALPFRDAGGELDVAITELPCERMERELSAFTGRRIRFHLIPPARLAPLLGTSGFATRQRHRPVAAPVGFRWRLRKAAEATWVVAALASLVKKGGSPPTGV